MIALDSNVLLRYLVGDEKVQALKARQLIDGAFSESEEVWVSLVVLCETAWVLKRVYSADRSTVAKTLDSIFSSMIRVENPELLREALRRFRRGKADFPDYVIGLVADKANARTTYTFDRGLRREPNFTLLT